MGQEVSSPLFCLDAGKQDSPQNLVYKYAKKLLPKNLKLLPFNVKEKEMRKKNPSSTWADFSQGVWSIFKSP